MYYFYKNYQKIFFYFLLIHIILNFILKCLIEFIIWFKSYLFTSASTSFILFLTSMVFSLTFPFITNNQLSSK